MLKCSGLFFGNHQSSRLRHLQRTAKSPELCHLRLESTVQEDTARSRPTTREPVLHRVQSYSSSSMTKSRNKEQTVGKKYSGIEFLQTSGRTPASGSALGDASDPHNEALRVRS
ncbi:hypothetical protein F2Q68_00044080 [Brassica cretica]|uniref:Uncharacterized protein n=2 Tax=Brassica cretica TaxID=69181 RepID=A0A8S9LU31_BRACR|nr:hypothetical protein F2Q68_00044080 [Brassica cretica]KAF3517450.1 hypothetical protein DY000_02060114 [Brassica cretica]